MQRGFSLIEVMVALVIFTMISVGAFGMLTGLQRSQASLEQHSVALETLQRASLIAWHDISQASPSPKQAQIPALTFTSANWPNPMQEARSTLAVIRYDSENDALIRQVWPLAAPANTAAQLRQTLADHVTNLHFLSIATAQKSDVPAATQMIYTLAPFGEIVQWVPLVQAP